MIDLHAVALDTTTLTGLVAISSAVAVLVSGVKRLALLVRPGLYEHPAWPLSVRSLAVVLGVSGCVAWLGLGVVEVAMGMLAGAGSEVVYRWAVRRLEAAAGLS